MRIANRWRRGLAALASAAALIGCGGGAGADSAPTVLAPPTAAATFTASSGEALASVQGVADAAAQVVELSASLGQGVVPIGGGGSSAIAAQRPSREQAQARQTVGCEQFIDIPGCTGSITIDTNLSDGATVAAPGSYVTLIFGDVAAASGGESLSIDGVLRLDFLTSFDFDTASFADQRFQLTFDGLTGSENGVAFGPFTLAALVEFDAQENSTVTIDGARLSRLENVQVTNAANYALGNVVLRRAAWSSATAHVDYDFGNWVVAAGRPSVGSTATVRAGADSIVVTVSASSTTTVVSTAVVTIGGTASGYIVTATYPAGGGAPSWVAVPGGS